MDYKKLFQQPTPASLWKRGAAYLIDFLLVALIIYPLQSNLTGFSQETFSALFSYLQKYPSLAFRMALIVLSSALLSILYWTLLEYYIRQSVGKLFLGISVASTTKQHTFFQCFLRNIPKISNILLLLDVIYLFFKGGHQRFFEVISHTEVIQGAAYGKI